MAASKNVRMTKDTSHTFIDGGLVRVDVGKDEKPKTFWVHEGLICARSKFFRNAMKKEWTEFGGKVVRLPDDTPKTFELYLTLLYTNTPPVIEDSTIGDMQFLKLVNLYILADKVIDIQTNNTIMYAMFVRTYHDIEFPPTEAIKAIYDGTTPGSPARRFFVDMYVHVGNGDLIQDNDEALPRKFLASVTRALMAFREVLLSGDDYNSPFRRLEDYIEELDENL